jgi:hypothetical protein
LGFFKTAMEKRGFPTLSFSSVYTLENGGASLHRAGTLNFSSYPKDG